MKGRQGVGWQISTVTPSRIRFLGRRGISALDHIVAPNIGHCHNAAYCFTLSGGQWGGGGLLLYHVIPDRIHGGQREGRLA